MSIGAQTAPRLSRETAGLLLGLVGVVIFGGTLPATRIALGAYSPWFVTCGRAVIASVAAAIILAALRRRFPREHGWMLMLAGILLTVGFPIMTAIAMQTVPAAHGGVVLGVLPLATSVFAALIAGERPSVLFWICGVVGAVLVVLFAARDGGMSLSAGDGWLFAAALCSSLGYVVSGRLARTMPGWEVICWALILTSPFSLTVSAWTWSPESLAATPLEIGALLYLGFGSMFLGYFAWNVGLAMGGIARVSQTQLLQTFVTLAISAVLLKEHLTLETLLFAAAVVAVVALGRRARVVPQIK